MRWDIFCKVIDNHGDLGVCWRLACELAARGQMPRLWVDDPSALAWMAPAGQLGVQVVHWTAQPPQLAPGEVVIEAFGCDPHEAFLAAMAEAAAERGRQSAWINLEYLSAESYVERCHGLPSPVMTGPASGLVKRFFYPGFTPGTGGLVREQDLDQRQQRFDRAAWLAGHGLPVAGERLVSLFCYEPPGLPALAAQLANGPVTTRLLVTAGRAAAAVRAAQEHTPWPPGLAITFLPALSQPDYDHLLWSCDLNLVRGEDSLVRALWARQPFAWQLYPQADGAHLPKMRAFLGWLDAPDSLRAFHEGWNGAAPHLPATDLAAWGPVATRAARRLHAQADLVTQLLAAAGQANQTG